MKTRGQILEERKRQRGIIDLEFEQAHGRLIGWSSSVLIVGVIAVAAGIVAIYSFYN